MDNRFETDALILIAFVTLNNRTHTCEVLTGSWWTCWKIGINFSFVSYGVESPSIIWDSFPKILSAKLLQMYENIIYKQWYKENKKPFPFSKPVNNVIVKQNTMTACDARFLGFGSLWFSCHSLCSKYRRIQFEWCIGVDAVDDAVMYVLPLGYHSGAAT